MQPSSDMFAPKLWSVLKEGYSGAKARADLIAGLTVAIVALPLSMAIAIASGVTPAMGLYTAIAGGFLVSAFSGSRHQIGGPAGAFIVLVAATVDKHGVDGLILATMLSGIMLFIAGWLRLGSYIKFIPYPVTVGFTAGIAVIIFASQIKDLFGLTLAGKEPGDLVAKLESLWQVRETVSPAAIAVSIVTITLILAIKKLRPHWPNLLIAVGVAAIGSFILNLPVETIGTRFGGIPHSVPLPHMPALSLDKIEAVLPAAFSFALLGAIESLLSAVVADGMTGRRHRSNVELVGQGIANVGSAIFGGFCVTGTIARTATNVRAGAVSPISGMAHAVILLLFMLLFAPLASYIPLAALAGVLATVAWNMIERPAFAALLRSSRGDALVLLATFLLVVFRDLTEGILVGFVLGTVLFIERMGRSVKVSPAARAALGDGNEGREHPVDYADPDVVAYHINGVFFFGAAATVGAVLDRIADTAKTFILDCSAVPFLDSTAANVIEGSLRKAEARGMRFFIAGASEEARDMLRAHHVGEPRVQFHDTIDDAFAEARALPFVGVAANGQSAHPAL
ncbi:SulP family inorganic anion transporter [Rhizobium alvei]|uniref:SulP family inorganic anion transporter n=1 Tax=Rhizobium alvei TaxID=1132659 RepID=A0ABT8YJP5_9HYPH|nr:SulP family inorganic anion transporter [Rhizobium alvei]MDO6963824.1 SulP family inorganic anion transporter [Rhizobium alvei]